jgi:hypothetical protein
VGDGEDAVGGGDTCVLGEDEMGRRVMRVLCNDMAIEAGRYGTWHTVGLDFYKLISHNYTV